MHLLLVLQLHAVALSVMPPPAAVRPVSQPAICATRWGLDRRHVTERMKREVARRAGIPWAARGQYEFDHRVARSVGGADTVANLQMQPWPIARQKDREEVRLWRLVCAGSLPLREAQRRLWNWSAP